MATRPGIVHLDDLGRRLWPPFAVERVIAAAGLDVAPWPPRHSFAPPRVVVAFVGREEPGAVRRSRRWLAECAHLVLVRIGRVDHDAELVELMDEPWREVLPELPHVEVVEWPDATDPAPCRAAIARALELAHGLDDVPAPVVSMPTRELPVSAWSKWTRESRYFIEQQIAAHLAIRDDRVVLVDATGAALDVTALPPVLSFDYDLAVIRGYPEGMAVDVARIELPGFVSGADPVHPISWRGVRMGTYWFYRGGLLSAIDHDYPNGPAKKLWGYQDNEPVAIALAPNADAYAITFGHDVLITSAVPLGWYRAGAVDVAAFRPDPQRATYYAYTDDFVERMSEDPLDEDNRELAPVVVLGPDANVRYAVDLLHHVVRITGTGDTNAAESAGGPNGGYIVCAADHRVVRRGTGTLLGGWFRHATIEDGGWIYREDLATGERTLVCSAERVACVDPDVEMVVHDAIREGRHDAAAQLRATHETRAIEGDRVVLAIPGTRNVLELVGDHLRVV